MKAPWTKIPAETRLGRLLIDEGLITDGDLAAALAKQAASPAYVPLGRLLVGENLITPRQLAHVLERSNKRPKLGEVLLRSGSISEEQLQLALQEQQRSKRPLGEVLIKLGHLTDEAMRQALCLQLDVPFVDLDRVTLDRGLTRLINRSYARRYWLVPVAQVGQVLTISMNDPTKIAVVDELSQLTGFVVNVVTSSQEAIRRAFKRLYDEAVDQPAPTAPESGTGQIETIAMSEPDGEPGGALKSRYVEEYIQDKKADTAVRQLLALGLERRCSDIHLEMLAGRLHARFRIDGILQELELGSLQPVVDQGAREIISRVKVLAKLDIAERRRPQDGSFRVRLERKGETQNIDFRVSIVPSYYGESCVLRILDKKNAPTNIDHLGFSSSISTKVKELMRRPAGILLVTGPTGSGKSTTLYAALMTAYRPEIRVLTAEDPIEYVYEQFSQSEVNERIGNTFSRYLRAFLRHDPEVIMIGEIRDEETAEMAFRAAQTGHLLLSTLHTNDAISTVTRLLDMKVDSNLLASSMLGVLSQRLARMVCPACKQEYRPSPDLMKEFFVDEPKGLTFYRGTGCGECNYTGYRGRASIAELWVPSEEDVILISKGAPFDEVRASARHSTISMATDVIERLSSGKTNLEELIRVMPYSAVYQFREVTAKGRAFTAPPQPALP
jgi:type II secretory ATPase GspE/PulE/Tfp pilus assembly ATPase PilB-like protein